MPDLEEAPPHAHPHANPWASDDPAEGDISNVQFIQTAPGRINLRATFTQSVTPEQFRAAGGVAPASIGGFMSMLNGIAGAAVRAQGQQPQGQPPQGQGQGQGLFSGPNQNQTQDQSAFNEARSQGADGQPQIRATRFAYHGGARLYPRDANNPEPHIEPVDDITK
jgi:E3 ubiquitin-protein ligase RNF115/126